MSRGGRQPPRRGMLEEFRASFNAATGLARAAGATAEPFLRRPGTQGDRYYRLHAMVGYLALMPLYCLFWQPPADLGPLFWFWAASVCALAVQQSAAAKAARQGRECHSQYGGESWLPAWSDRQAKRKVEPAFVVLAGFAAASWNPPLGVWLVLSGMGLGVAADHAERVHAAQIRVLRDARIEQEFIARSLEEEK